MDRTDAHAIPVARRKVGAMALSALLLAGCGTTVAEPRARTGPGDPLRLGVAAVDVISAYESTSAGGNIDLRIPETPVEQLEGWAASRLVPADGQGSLLVTVLRASLTEAALDKGKGLSSLVTDEQARLVRIEYEVSFSFSHPEDKRSATVNVSSDAERSIAESATPAEVERIRMDVVAEGLALLDREFRRQLQALNRGGWPLAGF